jgi:FkbM family methyltransferase
MTTITRSPGKILRRAKRVARIILGREFLYVQQKCPTEWHGSDYGGWTICPSPITKDSVVYSLGVGDDISFDLSMIGKYGVNVYAFDPTPKSIRWVRLQRLPKEFHFYEYAVLDYDGTAKFYPPDDPNWVSYTISAHQYATTHHSIEAPTRRLGSIMRELGHRRIDILKMDIEGSEYAVIKDMLQNGLEVSQLLVEFHHRFKDIGIWQTKRAIKLLQRHGYKIFSLSSRGDEISFIHTDRARQRFQFTWPYWYQKFKPLSSSSDRVETEVHP